MNLEEKISAIIMDELQRQSQAGAGALSVDQPREGVINISGSVNLEELAMAIAGALAGGP